MRRLGTGIIFWVMILIGSCLVPTAVAEDNAAGNKKEIMYTETCFYLKKT